MSGDAGGPHPVTAVELKAQIEAERTGRPFLAGSVGVDLAAESGIVAGAASPVATVCSPSETGAPVATAIAARPKSPADGNRKSGSLDIARVMTPSRSSGTSGTTELAVGGGSLTCA
jgi:hypothetical protein